MLLYTVPSPASPHFLPRCCIVVLTCTDNNRAIAQHHRERKAQTDGRGHPHPLALRLLTSQP